MTFSTFGYDADSIAQVAEDLFELDEQYVSQPRAKGAWSRKQILGHLIDSAMVNHARFLEAQGKDDLVFEGYPHERWVEIQRYQDQEWEELVTLWVSHNILICTIVGFIDEESLLKARDNHRLHKMAYRPVPQDQPTTLAYLIEDYFAHLKHHLDQIMDV